MLARQNTSSNLWKLTDSMKSEFSETKRDFPTSKDEDFLSDDQQERFLMYLQWVWHCRNHTDYTKTVKTNIPQDIDISNELLEKSAAGDVQEVARLLRGYNGHRCRSDLQTNGGHTAADIAKIWSRKRIASILSNESSSPRSSISNESNKPLIENLEKKHVSFNVLQRCSDKRKDLLWLDTKKKDVSTQFLLFSDLQIYVSPEKQSNDDTPQRHQLIAASYKDIDFFLNEEKSLNIFLGTEPLQTKNEQSKKDRAWFAIDVSSMDKDKLESILPNGHFVSPFPAFLNLNEYERCIFSEACSLILWHMDHQFCPTCGCRTIPEDAGLKRECTNGKCLSRSGLLNTNYPRVDPNVVVLVVNSSQTHCLMGLKKNFPSNMFFCVSGYIEPGESIEDACTREILEQVNLDVVKVEYHSSQPWPYPVVLLVGCTVHVATEVVKVNEEELKDATWFHFSEAELMIKGKHEDGYKVPSKQTLTYQLLDSWLETHRDE
ncbi:peroxisomal NADH pyrophosphatase NUDT12-like [Octopus sinensis]|uniref:NAD(+) diphosphatase n=1 Tax=Octopus sinensis TaxID=2607531 RepID=A0A6P7SYL5_9MOLL|nr:peroxisomal NADH pyrophosphatase NUDT12-like [Octopus sinensis]